MSEPNKFQSNAMLLLLILLTISLEVQSLIFFDHSEYSNMFNCDELMNNYESLKGKVAEAQEKFKHILNWTQFGMFVNDYYELNLMSRMLM